MTVTNLGSTWQLVQPHFGPVTSIQISATGFYPDQWRMDNFTYTTVSDYIGGYGNDILVGGAGDDRFYGNYGNDTFVHVAGGGNDTIIDFAPHATSSVGNQDKIDFTGETAVYSVNDVLALATQNGADTVIQFGGAEAFDSLTLKNVQATDLTDADFVFATFSGVYAADYWHGSNGGSGQQWNYSGNWSRGIPNP